MASRCAPTATVTRCVSGSWATGKRNRGNAGHTECAATHGGLRNWRPAPRLRGPTASLSSAALGASKKNAGRSSRPPVATSPFPRWFPGGAAILAQPGGAPAGRDDREATVYAGAGQRPPRLRHRSPDRGDGSRLTTLLVFSPDGRHAWPGQEGQNTGAMPLWDVTTGTAPLAASLLSRAQPLSNSHSQPIASAWPP